VLVVVVVVDGHADVVQQRRGPQQLALDGLALMHSRGGQLVEQAECEAGDVGRVRAVLRVHPVLRGEIDDARVTHVLEQRRVAEVVLEEHALAQAGLGDLEALEAADLHDRLHDDRAAEDDVAARWLDAGELGALGRLREASSSTRRSSSSRAMT
jgi:hypothetical protein